MMRSWSFTQSRIVVAILVVLGAIGGAGGCASPSNSPRGGIVVAIDYSLTFAPLTPTDNDSLQVITETMKELTIKHLEQPVKLYVMTIGASGFTSVEPCGPATMFKFELIKSGAPGVISDEAGLQAWLEMCSERLVALSKTHAGSHTALTESVRLASSNLDMVDPNQRFLVIYSDFLEDLPQGSAAPADLKLNGERVALIWRAGLDEAKSQTTVRARALMWKKKLEQSGASSVCDRPAAGLVMPDLLVCLGF